MGIRVERAELLLQREAGEVVEKDKPQISLLNHGHLLIDWNEVDLIIKQVQAETNLGSVLFTGLITLQWGFKTNESEGAFFSDLLKSFQSGEFDLILGHAESWSTSTAKSITNASNKDQLILNLYCRWWVSNKPIVPLGKWFQVRYRIRLCAVKYIWFCWMQ